MTVTLAITHSLCLYSGKVLYKCNYIIAQIQDLNQNSFNSLNCELHSLDESERFLSNMESICTQKFK